MNWLEWSWPIPILRLHQKAEFTAVVPQKSQWKLSQAHCSYMLQVHAHWAWLGSEQAAIVQQGTCTPVPHFLPVMAIMSPQQIDTLAPALFLTPWCCRNEVTASRTVSHAMQHARPCLCPSVHLPLLVAALLPPHQRALPSPGVTGLTVVWTPLCGHNAFLPSLSEVASD